MGIEIPTGPVSANLDAASGRSPTYVQSTRLCASAAREALLLTDVKPKLLFLFPDGWDEAAIGAVPALGRDHEVAREGFDLFRFPENANLLWFDARRFVSALVRRYRGAGVAGVVSTNEQYGALIAATVARELALHGTDPAATVRAQHKYYARQALAAALPDANPAFTLLPYGFGRTDAVAQQPALPYPLFVKPVKAAYSVLARRVDDAAALSRHFAFGRWEAHVIRRLVQPFDDLMREHAQFTVSPLHMLGEAIMDGVQVNVDGWMDRGRVGFFGIVDAAMYPGTQAFARFEYPSRLPPDAQARAFDVAERAIRAVGFDHGCFNVELFWEPATQRMRIVEINPRLAAQFGDLYWKVDGTHPYAVLADLATGRSPRFARRQGNFAAAASFVLRAFDDAAKVAPSRADRDWLAARYPDASLTTFIKRRAGRAREAKWLGSYRYAIVNLGGNSREDLELRFADLCRHVRFDGPRGAQGMLMPTVNSAALAPSSTNSPQ